ncbi:MAG TPA: archease [Bryobacteraceae bacterium]|nr:archease [Bryobacteraceae bacterium]
MHQSDPGYEVLEHAADLGFRAHAPTLPELFARAAEALADIAMETEGIEPRQTYWLAAEGESREALLVNWLSEVLYHLDGRQLALRTFHVKEFTGSRIAGEAFGERRDPARQPAKLVVKGVTWHQLRIGQDQRGWFCEVFLDV